MYKGMEVKKAQCIQGSTSHSTWLEGEKKNMEGAGNEAKKAGRTWYTKGFILWTGKANENY